MRTRGRVLAGNAVAGLALGYALSNIGFADYGELNRMFTFQDLRMFWTFLGAAALAAAVTPALLRRRSAPPRIHAGVVPGAVLFGVGWAVCGGCPSIPIVQLAGGYLPAAVTLGGIVVGVRLFRWVNVRFLHLDPGSCG